MEINGHRPEVQQASIVALGKFNPAIFQPQWYSTNKLIRLEEADHAQIDVIHNELTAFSAEWFKIEVTTARFAITTEDPTKHLPLRDLAVGTFRILEHTPLTAVGFNWNQQFAMESKEQWHAVGDHYAPKEPWASVLGNPGLRLLIMEGMREGSESKRISVQMGPSPQPVGYGVHVAINEHYDFDQEKSSQDRMQKFVSLCGEVWEPFLKYAESAAATLLNRAKNEERK